MHKSQKTIVAKIQANESCCICGKPSLRVCNECLAECQLACFCDKHVNNHKFERMHVAFWGVLGE